MSFVPVFVGSRAAFVSVRSFSVTGGTGAFCRSVTGGIDWPCLMGIRRQYRTVRKQLRNKSRKKPGCLFITAAVPFLRRAVCRFSEGMAENAVKQLMKKKQKRLCRGNCGGVPVGHRRPEIQKGRRI